MEISRKIIRYKPNFVISRFVIAGVYCSESVVKVSIVGAFGFVS